MQTYIITNPLIKQYILKYLGNYWIFIDDKDPWVLHTLGKKRETDGSVIYTYMVDFTIRASGIRSSYAFTPNTGKEARYLYGLCNEVNYVQSSEDMAI